MRVSDITYTGLSGAGRFSATLPHCPGGGVGYPLPTQHPDTPAGRTPDRIIPQRARSLIALRNPAATALASYPIPSYGLRDQL